MVNQARVQTLIQTGILLQAGAAVSTLPAGHKLLPHRPTQELHVLVAPVVRRLHWLPQQVGIILSELQLLYSS